MQSAHAISTSRAHRGREPSKRAGKQFLGRRLGQLRRKWGEISGFVIQIVRQTPSASQDPMPWNCHFRHKGGHLVVSMRHKQSRACLCAQKTLQSARGNGVFRGARRCQGIGKSGRSPVESDGTEFVKWARSRFVQMAESGKKQARNVPEGLRSWRTAFRIPISLACLPG